jgi:hypothetical protein
MARPTPPSLHAPVAARKLSIFQLRLAPGARQRPNRVELRDDERSLEVLTWNHASIRASRCLGRPVQ